MKTLYLYTTEGCHLCEHVEALVEPFLVPYGLVLEPIEIADSPELMARYGVRIPVLRLAGENRELGWPFNREELIALLEGGGAS